MNTNNSAEFIISKSIFIHEAQYLDKFIPARLRCEGFMNEPGFLLFKVEQNKVTLTALGNDGILQQAFDPDEYNQLKITTSSNDPIYLFVPAKHLFKVIKRVRSDYLRFVLYEDDYLEIRDGDCVFSLQALDIEDFPFVRLPEIDPSFSLTMLELAAVVREVSFAASPGDFREQLMGVHFKFKKDGLYCEGTDSFRLARKILHKSGPLGVEVIVPASAIRHALKIFKFHKDVSFAFEGKIIQIKDGNCLYQLEGYDEPYPDFDKILPDKSSYKTTMTLDTEEFREALDQCKILADSSTPVKVEMEANPENVSVSFIQKNVGCTKQILPEFAVEGEPIRICFNAQYMLDAIRALNTHKRIMNLQLIADKKPILITKPDDPDLFLMVVPMRR